MSSISPNLKGTPFHARSPSPTDSEKMEQVLKNSSIVGQASFNRTVDNRWIAPPLRESFPIYSAISPVGVAQAILNTTGQHAAAADVEKALSGRADSIASVAALEPGARALQTISRLEGASSSASIDPIDLANAIAGRASSAAAAAAIPSTIRSLLLSPSTPIMRPASRLDDIVAQTNLFEFSNAAMDERESSGAAAGSSLPRRIRKREEETGLANQGNTQTGAASTAQSKRHVQEKVRNETDELYLLNTPIQEAARSGDLSKIREHISECGDLPVSILHHAFLLAARHGKKEIVSYFSEITAIPQDWVYYAIIEIVQRRTKDFRSLGSQPGKPPSDVPCIEEWKAVLGSLSDKEGLEMIEHLLVLHKLPEDFLRAIAEFVGTTFACDIWDLLLSKKLMTTECRNRAIANAIDYGTKEPRLAANILERCICNGLDTVEERSWALSRMAAWSYEYKNLYNQLIEHLKSGKYSYEDRVEAFKNLCEEECLIDEDRPAFLALATVGLSRQDRSWAFSEAVSATCGNTDNSSLWIIRKLTDRYKEEDQGQVINNYGVSDDALSKVLSQFYVYDNTAKMKGFFERFTITDEVIDNGVEKTLEDQQRKKELYQQTLRIKRSLKGV